MERIDLRRRRISSKLLPMPRTPTVAPTRRKTPATWNKGSCGLGGMSEHPHHATMRHVLVAGKDHQRLGVLGH